MVAVTASQKRLNSRGLQLPLSFMLDVKSWEALDVGQLPSWDQTNRVCIDLETRDDFLVLLGPGVRRGATVVGIAFAIEDGPAHYLPIAHEGGDNLDPEQVWRYIRENAKKFKGDIVGANLQYDLDFLLQNGVEFGPDVMFRDVLVAEPLLDELQLSYSLENVGKRRLGIGKEEDGLTQAVKAFGLKPKTKRDVKQAIWRLPGRHVTPYAIQDVRLPLQLLAAQERELERQDLWRVWELESKLLPVLVRMRRRGVRVDEDRLDAVGRWAMDQEREKLQEIARQTGVSIPVGGTMATEACLPLFKQMQVLVPKGTNGKPSITADWLKALKHPMADLFLRARQMAKVQSTYVNATKDHLINGRIHCTFNQVKKQKEESNDLGGAGYGRMSCEDPNLQNQPSRDDEIGPRWRSIYIPEEGGLWGSMDYSQQEPKMGIHFAIASGPKVVGMEGWQRAKKLAQMFVDDPKLDTYLALVRAGGLTSYLAAGLDNEVIVKDKMTAAEIKSRKYAKELQLGVTYGMGGPKLCGKLGLPTVMIQDRYASRKGITKMVEAAGPEGQRVIDVFDNELPFIRKLAKAVQEAANDRGYVKTLLGRKCRFPMRDDGRYDWTQKALNRVIQGSSGDQTKQAVVDLDAAGHFVQLQVHDEIAASLADVAEGRRASELMSNCIKLHLPSRVDLEVGPSWGEAKGVD